MHILMANDDGIGAKGIMALYRAAVKRGHRVSMCAPKSQQSASSQRFSIQDPLFVSDYPLDAPGCQGFAIGGSPADCVRLGLNQLVNDPVDIVMSGINEGYNAGVAVHYSGTVGAAKEASFHDLPAMAVSIHHRATDTMLDAFATYAVTLAESYVHKTLPADVLLNVNAPCREACDLLPPVYAPIAKGHFQDAYEKRQSPRGQTYYWMAHNDLLPAADPQSDIAMLEKGHITLTLVGNLASLDKAVWQSLHID